MPNMPMPFFVVFLVLFGFALVCVLLLFVVFRLWIKALANGITVSVLTILGMHLRGSPPRLIIDTTVALRQAGKTVSVQEVEQVFQANKVDILRRPSRYSQAYTLAELMKRSMERGGVGEEGPGAGSGRAS